MKHHCQPASWRLLSLFIAALLLVAGCNSAGSSTSDPAIVDQAASEATAIIQRAQATAMVLQAQAQATVLIQNANASASTPGQTVPSPTPGVLQTSITPEGVNTPLQATPAETPGVDQSDVKLLGVSLGTESGLILVQFKAPPAVTHHWLQGSVYVTDEATGALYNEIPVEPIIGPLFARPINASQIGYVMFVNLPIPLRSGELVTVNLGEYIFEHVSVK